MSDDDREREPRYGGEMNAEAITLLTTMLHQKGILDDGELRYVLENFPNGGEMVDDYLDELDERDDL